MSNAVWFWDPQIAVNLGIGGAAVAQTPEARAACEASVANGRQRARGAFQSVEDDPAAASCGIPMPGSCAPARMRHAPGPPR